MFEPKINHRNFTGWVENLRQEQHVAQQSRIDNLRVFQDSTSVRHIQDFSDSLVRLPGEMGLNPDLIRFRNVRNSYLPYDPEMFTSEMHNFSTNTTLILSAQKDAMVHQEPSSEASGISLGPLDASFPNNFSTSSKENAPQKPIYWKELDPSRSCNWATNYVNGSGNNACNQYPSFVGGILSGTMKESNMMMHGNNGHQEVKFPLTNSSSEIPSQCGEMQFNSPSFYQNTLQEVINSSTIKSQGFDMVQNFKEREHNSLVDVGNELVLLPTYADGINVSRLNDTAAWIHRPVEGCHLWNAETAFPSSKGGGGVGTFDRGLSLSLSSHSPSELHVDQFGGRFGSEDLQCRIGIFNGPQELESNNPSNVCSSSKPSIVNKGCRNSIQGIAGSSTYVCQSAGPLGPFTGYAMILKGSKFLKPTQQMLNEFCCVIDPKLFQMRELSERCSGDAKLDTMNAENEIFRRSGKSCVPSLYGCKEYSEGAYGSGSFQSYQPEFQQKKAKLLFMQEEVCRRYKQYQQQMQMVVSSFETVEGLRAATPYISLALKKVYRHFKCLKNTMLDQLQHVSKALGEDVSSPTTGACGSKGHTATQRLKFIDQSLGKHKFEGVVSQSYFEAQQHVWRPHRGLPERSVAVLRAWLFEHFLHPYPTDTDKHILATQTGLSRNQVSNWFINARVRVWKPMVEEIHMLETKGSTEMELNSKENGEGTRNNGNFPSGDKKSNKIAMDVMSENRIMECSDMSSMRNPEEGQKDSRIQASLDESMVSFMPPYHRSGFEIGGLGSVSLTLGLRHSTETTQQQQQ